MKKDIRIDPLTGEKFIPKKTTQRFASPENRIKYNNEKASLIRQNRAFVDKPLHTNHAILVKEMGDCKEVSLHEEYLRGRGYNFNVVTHYDKWEGKTVRCIYEFMILPMPSIQHIKIIRNDRY